MSWNRAAASLALVLLVAATACGKDDEEPDGTPTPAASASTATTGTPSTSPTATATTTSPAVGLPEDFPPQDEVPLVPGVVTKKDGGTNPEGKQGWILELAAPGSQKECFDRAAAALTAAGFTKQGELDAQGTRQAQFTTATWAVIISARADGDNCQLGYEVGQLTE